MPLWLVEILSDFCRWRARAAHRRVERNLDSAFGWLEIERQLIRKGIGNGTEETGR